MLDASLILCALAGAAVAIGIRRYRGPDAKQMNLEVERSILAKCMEHLEQPEYATERSVLYEKYQSKLARVNDTLPGKRPVAIKDDTEKMPEIKDEPGNVKTRAKKSASKGSRTKKRGAKGDGTKKGDDTSVKSPKKDTVNSRSKRKIKTPKDITQDDHTRVTKGDAGKTSAKPKKKPKSKAKKANGAGSKPPDADTAVQRSTPKVSAQDTSSKQMQDDTSGQDIGTDDKKDTKEYDNTDTGQKGSGPDKGLGTDDTDAQEDLEKIKDDIQRALSKLERAEAD